MFLDTDFIFKNKPNEIDYLAEAEGDETTQNNPENQTNDEQSIEQKEDISSTDETDTPQNNDMNDDMNMDDDMGMGGDDSDEQGDDSTESFEADNDGTKSEPSEGMKKKKLLQDYRQLLSIYDDTVNALAYINYGSLSPNEKKIFNYIEDRIKTAGDNINIVVQDQYEVISYVRLLKLYMYFKLQLKTFSDIIKELVET